MVNSRPRRDSTHQRASLNWSPSSDRRSAVKAKNLSAQSLLWWYPMISVVSTLIHLYLLASNPHKKPTKMIKTCHCLNRLKWRLKSVSRVNSGILMKSWLAIWKCYRENWRRCCNPRSASWKTMLRARSQKLRPIWACTRRSVPLTWARWGTVWAKWGFKISNWVSKWHSLMRDRRIRVNSMRNFQGVSLF